MADTFTCARCGGEFTKGWKDSQAEAEFERLYGGRPDPKKDDVICDDCFQELIDNEIRRWKPTIPGLLPPS